MALINFPEVMSHLAFIDVLMVVYTAKNGPQEQKECFLLGTSVSILKAFMSSDFLNLLFKMKTLYILCNYVKLNDYKYSSFQLES